MDTEVRITHSYYLTRTSSHFRSGTETANIALGGKIRDGVEVKILDVPELNMFSTDKPFPRGECAVKTKDMFPGYFNDDDRT